MFNLFIRCSVFIWCFSAFGLMAMDETNHGDEQASTFDSDEDSNVIVCVEDGDADSFFILNVSSVSDLKNIGEKFRPIELARLQRPENRLVCNFVQVDQDICFFAEYHLDKSIIKKDHLGNNLPILTAEEEALLQYEKVLKPSLLEHFYVVLPFWQACEDERSVFCQGLLPEINFLIKRAITQVVYELFDPHDRLIFSMVKIEISEK